MSDIEINACPRCGSVAYLRSLSSKKLGFLYFVACNNPVCQISKEKLEAYPSEEAAIRHWNEQAETERAEKEVELKIKPVADTSNDTSNDRSNEMKRFYSDELIKGAVESYHQQIKQAKNEAIKRNIKANVIAISDKLFYSKLTLNGADIPMILGLKCCYSEELPDDVLFALFESGSPPENLVEENKRLKDEIQELKDKLHRIAEFIVGVNNV